MRMEEQVLAPGMQDADESNPRTEPLRVGGDFAHRGGTAAEEQVVQEAGIALAERVQLMRQRENHVEVADRQQFQLTGREPALPGLRLALHAMTVAAGVIRDDLMTTLGTGIDVPTQLRRAAAGDGTQHRQLLNGQPRTLFQEVIALRAEYIGHLHGRPAHAGFRFFRKRVSGVGSGRLICSSGLGVDCR